MAELLEEREGLTVSRETLRIWLSRPKKHKRPKHRMRRIPSENFGDMLQIDGSFHHWFGETETCMMNIVDDATKIAEISFDQEETIDSACRCAWRWVKKYGVPKSFYADGRNMYHWLERKGKDNFFTTMCRLLSIRVITAYSGQAKGRVERANGVHQDRLVPLMALDGIGTIKEANQYAKSYMAKHNRKFRMKQAGTNTHRPLPEWVKSMDDVFFIEEERTIGNDWTVSYNGKTYQIPKQSHYPPAKSKITLKITISGRITTSYRGCNLNLQ